MRVSTEPTTLATAPAATLATTTTTATTHGLEATNLAFAIERRFVLLDLSLSLRGGEVVAVAGANGAGKTTLLSLLAGDTTPDRGEIRLDGFPFGLHAPADLARAIGTVGHLPGLYLDLSAIENLTLFAALAGRPCSREAAIEALVAVGLAASDAARRVRHYSRGMVQRAAIARLAICGARYWLLDEPSTGLDPRGCAVLAQTLRAAADAGRGVLFVSHDPGLLEIADRTLDLDNGQLKTRQRPEAAR